MIQLNWEECFLIHGIIPVALYSNMLTSRDSNKILYIRWRSFKNIDKL